MTALSDALRYQRLVESDAAMRMLRSDGVAIVAALLLTHLGAENRRVAADDLYEAIDADLIELREHFDLPRAKNAKAYCADWREAGLLTRRAAVESRGETLELSPAALAAIRIVDRLEAPTTSLTESRLASLAAQLHELALESDPDATRRLGALVAERERLDAEIARLESGGEVHTIKPSRALERVADILEQAADLPTDFARVRARFEELNGEVRAGILDGDDSNTTVIDDIFRGVNLIESSDEGRTFVAFTSLLLDPERSATLESDIRSVLDREFAGGLSPAERRVLRSFLRTLRDRSTEIHGALTVFARSLRRYVQQQDYQRERVLRRSVQRALAAAVQASAHTKPYRQTGIDLDLTALPLSTAGELSLHDPADFAAPATLDMSEAPVVDLEALRLLARETEIDFDELERNVNAAVADGPATIGELLARWPATQGVASVVGLVALAVRHGDADPSSLERVEWTGIDAIDRAAQIPVHRFTERIG